MMAILAWLAQAMAGTCGPCSGLDAVDEACEAAYGDAHPLCKRIGAADESCPDEVDDDGDTTEASNSETSASSLTCDELCTEVEALDDACDRELGEQDPVCLGLDPLAEACEASGANEGDDDDDDEQVGSTSSRRRATGPTADGIELHSCAVVGGSAGFAILIPLGVGLALRRRGGVR